MGALSLRLPPIPPLLAVGLALALIPAIQAASVGLAGYTNDFTTKPAATDWATVGVSGMTSDITTAAGLDAAVAVLVATNITTQVVGDAVNPPTGAPTAKWSSTGRYLQCSASSTKFTALVAKLVNDTGADANAVSIIYDYALVNAITEQVPGLRVYYNLTGATNHWTSIPGLSNAMPGRVAVGVSLSGSWTNGTTLYLLWADDNATASPDTACQIDNFFIRVGAMPASAAMSTPTNGQTLLQGATVPVTATGTGALTNLAIYLDETLLLSGSSSSLTTTLPPCGLAAGAHTVYARAADGNGVAYSATNVFTLTPNAAPTITLSNAGPASVLVGTPITLNATATDDAGVASVDFHLDGVIAFTDTNAPWTWALNGLRPGSHASYAVANDRCGLSTTSAPIVMTVAGSVLYTTDFNMLPPANRWTWFSSNGTAGSVTTAAGFDGVVAVLPAAIITNQVVSDANNPPGVSISAVWSSTGGYVQTRSTGNGFNVLMASLTNDTGLDLTSFAVGYTFTQAEVLYEEISGHRVYFSLTGAPNSWTNLPALSSAGPGMLGTNVNVTWRSNTVIYLLWADDNGSQTDTANQIDNFFASVILPPSILSLDPTNGLVCPGGTPVLTVNAAGTPPLRYQWRRVSATETNNILGATNAAYAIASASTNDEGGYVVVVSNVLGSVTSSVVTLVVASLPVGFTSQPLDRAVVFGETVIFNAGMVETASRPVALQWFWNDQSNSTTGLPINGANQSQWVITNAGPVHAGFYYAVASNCVNTVTSSVAQLAVSYLPLSITVQPQGGEFLPGSFATLSVSVSGSAVSYQWFKRGTAMPGATNATLVFANFQPADSGFYHVVVSNPVNTVISSYATLSVLRPPMTLVGLTEHSWRYNQNGVDLGTNWRAVEFDDSTWAAGRGVFAKEDNAAIVPLINTVLSLTNAAGATNLTFYFRTKFVLTEDPANVSIVISNLVDDGHVVYLNGTEIYRSTNMPAGTVGYSTPTRAAHTENEWEVAALPAGLLVSGTNTLAVELHQLNAYSSDLVFGLSATVNFLPPTVIEITNQPQSATAWELEPASFTVGYVGTAAVVQWFKDGAPISGATGRTLTVPEPRAADAGDYYAVISNVLNVVISQVATLTVLADTNAPFLWSATRAANLTEVLVGFSERLEAVTATSALNYTIQEQASGSFVAVHGAVLTNGTEVLLTTDPLGSGLEYVLTVSGVGDASARTNLIAPNSRIVIGGGSLPLIAVDAVWKYNDTGSDLGTSWRERDFDDSAWPSGAAALFNDDWSHSPSPLAFPTNTVLAVTNVTGVPIVTHYFRHRFNFQATPDGAVLALRPIVDDGAVFYLNGLEIYRLGLAAGPLTSATPAPRLVPDGHYEGPFLVPVTNLIWGDNVLAVETHQSRSTLDVSFGVEVVASVTAFDGLAPFFTDQPQSQTVTEGRSVTFGAHLSAAGWLQWFRNGVVVPFANHTTLSMPSVSSADNGAQFTLLTSNFFGAVTSAVATLTVVPDTNRPTLVSAMVASNNAPSVVVTFSRPLDPATATNFLNYTITNAVGADLTVVRAELTEERSVMLTIGEWWPGVFTLVVSGVRDATPSGNEIIANSRATVGLQNCVLVADGVTVWRYNQNNVDLGTAWRAVSYDDSSWSNGVALFDGKTGGRSAAERADFPEPVGSVLDVTNQTSPIYSIPTYYFRTKFTSPLLGPGASMTGRHVIDDGAAFYLNGQLVYAIRVNLPTAFGAYGGTVAPSTDYGIPIFEGPFNVPVTNLFSGTNLLAVELKNYGPSSSDITFGAWLYLNVPSVVLPPGGPTTPQPLQIIRQPQSLAVAELEPARFTVGYSGTPTLIQWYQRGPGGAELIPDASSPMLTIPSAISGMDDFSYFVVVSNSFGAVASADASLTITQAPPFIVTQPASQSVGLGQPARFEVLAYGSLACFYQWRFNNVDIPAATNASYDIPAATTNHVGAYSVLVSNALGVALSAPAQLTLSAGFALDAPDLTWTMLDRPWFVQTDATHDGVDALQSGDTSGGGYSTIQTILSGPSLLSFWWKKDGGVSESALAFSVDGIEIARVSNASDWEQRAFYLSAGQHTNKWAFNGYQAAWLDEVVCTTNDLGPVILTFPEDATVAAGTNLALQAVVSGYPPLRYQWYRDEVELPQATNATLRLVDAPTSASGVYTLMVSNPYGTAFSGAALTVVDSGPGFMPQRLRVAAVPGMPAVLRANALGSEPRTYQWRLGGVEILGATNDSLVLWNVSARDAGSYSVVVSNAFGLATGPNIKFVVGWFSNVVHISVDGLSAKYLANGLQTDPARYPNFQRFLTEGVSTLNARCDYDISYTVPNHLCMLLGRPALQPAGQPNTVPHGYTPDYTPNATTTVHNRGNTNVSYKASVFDVVHDHGFTTAFLAGKTSLTVCAQSYDATNGAPDLIPPDNGRSKIDYVLYTSSAIMVNAFLPSLTNGAPYQYAFLHFADLDYAGHSYGWGSPSWFDAVQAIDTQLGRLFAAIENNAASTESLQTAVILTADHGGFGPTHLDPTLDYDYTIPLLVWGPSFPAGTDLYSLFANRADPGTNRPDYNAIWQPLRNGDSGNLALAMLGLPPIPGSTLIPLFPTTTPSLTLAAQGQSVFVEWTAGAAGFGFEMSESLGPSAAWTKISDGIVTNVNSFKYEVPLSGPPRFFRLRK